MELLELLVWPWQINYTIWIQNIANNGNFILQLVTGASPSSIQSPAAGNVIATLGEQTNITTSGAVETLYPLRYSFVNNDGFGYLLATDSFNSVVDSNVIGAVITVSCKLMYRFVEVDMADFVGLVQSQNQSTQ